MSKLAYSKPVLTEYTEFPHVCYFIRRIFMRRYFDRVTASMHKFKIAIDGAAVAITNFNNLACFYECKLVEPKTSKYGKGANNEFWRKKGK